MKSDRRTTQNINRESARARVRLEAGLNGPWPRHTVKRYLPLVLLAVWEALSLLICGLIAWKAAGTIGLIVAYDVLPLSFLVFVLPTGLPQRILVRYFLDLGGSQGEQLAKGFLFVSTLAWLPTIPLLPWYAFMVWGEWWQLAFVYGGAGMWILRHRRATRGNGATSVTAGKQADEE